MDWQERIVIDPKILVGSLSSRERGWLLNLSLICSRKDGPKARSHAITQALRMRIFQLV